MMLPKKLPIVVHFGFWETSISSNFFKFSRLINKNLTIHIKRVFEILIISLVINYRYYLIWFLTTLMVFAHAQYKFYIEKSIIK